MDKAGMITGSYIPAKEFEGKLWILADAYQQAMQGAYMGGVLAEREACANVCDSYDVAEDVCISDTAEGIAIAIRARGQ
jgi:hypothetical protein